MDDGSITFFAEKVEAGHAFEIVGSMNPLYMSFEHSLLSKICAIKLDINSNKLSSSMSI